MVQDSPSFQSQQYVQGIQEQSANRQERYVDRYAQSRQQIAEVPMRFMQARGMAMEQQRMQQEQQMRLSQVASDLANDQLHRQQAQEDLLWSQQLHQADMIGLQKRGMAAEIALKEAQTKKAIDELGGEKIPYAMLTPERMDYAISELGIMANPSDNMRIRPATPDERSAAGQRIKSRQQQVQQDELEQIRTRNEGRASPPESLETQRAMGIAKDRINFLLTELEHMQVPQRGASDEERDAYATKRASIEKEVQQLSREASQLGRTDQPGESQQEPEMTVDSFLSRQSAEALKLLYPGGK